MASALSSLSIARVCSSSPARRKVSARAVGGSAAAPPPGEWPFGRAWIESLTLFRSDLGPGGARYTALATFPLGGAAA